MPKKLSHRNLDTVEILEQLKGQAFDYFRHEYNPVNGLIADKNQPGSPASIAALGIGFSVYTIASERGLLPRAEAAQRILTSLRFLKNSHQGPEADATGYKGFYYHYLDMQTGKRAWQSELSTIDTALLMAGVLNAQAYFDMANETEDELRELADFLYRRVEWTWMQHKGKTIVHGWKPERKFLPYRWNVNFSEALILYALALGSPTHPIDRAGYEEWTATFKMLTIYGIESLHAGPLFIHQMSHLWIDFRGIYDRFNRETGFDYFENSHRATKIQQAYAIHNPKEFPHYSNLCWGLTASDGPGPAVRSIKGRRRSFFDYRPRGVPEGPDDGTFSPWSVIASLPFAPDIVLATIDHMVEKIGEKGLGKYGFSASYNPAFPTPAATGNYDGWVSPWVFGINQGPTIMMIENYQSDFIWQTMKKCPYLANGLRAAGFEGGWLQSNKGESSHVS